MKKILIIIIPVLVIAVAVGLFFAIRAAESGKVAAEDSKESVMDIDLNDMDAVLAKMREEEEPMTVRILGIGNSWARDDFRWLCAMLEDAGYTAVVGQAYLGGSNLYHQYFGVFDEDYTYSHDGTEQVVHSTYQYQKYTGAGTRVLTPTNDEYNNGLNNVGVTLESIVSDEPWDIIIFQQSAQNAGLEIGWTDPENTDTYVDADGNTVTLSWDIKDFVAAVLDMMPEGAERPRVGLSIPWAPADGTADSAMKTYYENYNGGVVPTTDEERTAVYESIHLALQDTCAWAAKYMDADFVCNPGLAIYNARQNDFLSAFGWNMQRAQTNTHLASGIPMYVAGMAILHDALGVTHTDFNWYPTGSTTSYAQEDTDGETVETVAEPNEAIAWIARVYGETAG